MFKLESDDQLFTEPMGELDQMRRDLRSQAISETGSLVELVFDQESSSVSSSIEISDSLQLGYNVHNNAEDYLNSSQ